MSRAPCICCCRDGAVIVDLYLPGTPPRLVYKCIHCMWQWPVVSTAASWRRQVRQALDTLATLKRSRSMLVGKQLLYRLHAIRVSQRHLALLRHQRADARAMGGRPDFPWGG